MKVAIVTLDSDIGAAIALVHLARGDTVQGTSRKDERLGPDIRFMELSDRSTWRRLDQDVDRVYFTIALTDNKGVPMKEVMNINSVLPVKWLEYCLLPLRPGAKVVVLSSAFGSIELTASDRARVYRMSKAALNIGVKCLSFARPDLHWCVMHPGLVQTKMISTAPPFGTKPITPASAGHSCVDVIDKWTGKFEFLSYDGSILPW